MNIKRIIQEEVDDLSWMDNSFEFKDTLTNTQLWELMREEWQEWQKNAHQEDRMSLLDFADEYSGTTFHGARVINDFGEIKFKYY
tara:strand:- start:196 stop:450 length:255 start_codon:yes stop_codon:yes gene_type:complete